MEDCAMNPVNPDKLRLMPGQSMQAACAAQGDEPGEVGFFIRSLSQLDRRNGEPTIQQRAGLISFNEVLLVLTMIRVEDEKVELFDFWWDFFSPDAPDLFRTMSSQKNLTVYFYGNEGKYRTVDTENTFRKFFSFLPELFEKSDPWTEVEFDRAVRGFCAQSYPRENLWDMIQTKAEIVESGEGKPVGIEDYAGIIPDQLRQFYDYLPTQGHCIRVIPSAFENKATDGDPAEFLFPAPVKTVLRCGLRWVKGYPVAPIPFIPGHGLAVPPDDEEY
jgi:hypothetical protein